VQERDKAKQCEEEARRSKDQLELTRRKLQEAESEREKALVVSPLILQLVGGGMFNVQSETEGEEPPSLSILSKPNRGHGTTGGETERDGPIERGKQGLANQTRRCQPQNQCEQCVAHWRHSIPLNKFVQDLEVKQLDLLAKRKRRNANDSDSDDEKQSTLERGRIPSDWTTDS